MFRVLLAAAFVAGCLSLAASAAAGTIYVENNSADISDAQVAAAIPAFQKAVDQNFAPIWHEDATLVFLGGRAAPVGAESILVTPDVNCMDCLGYHDVLDGTPYAVVLDTTDWETTFTHELFEMLANPLGNRAVHTRKGWYMVEVSDPVESYSYQVNGVAISDFVFPSWYQGGKKPYDFMRVVTRVREVLPGGYQIHWKSGQWVGE